MRKKTSTPEIQDHCTLRKKTQRPKYVSLYLEEEDIEARNTGHCSLRKKTQRPKYVSLYLEEEDIEARNTGHCTLTKKT